MTVGEFMKIRSLLPICSFLAILSGIVLPDRAYGQDTPLPVQLRTLLLFKTLTLDQNIAKGRTELRIGVVSSAGNKLSEADAQAMAAQIGKILHMRVKGLKVVINHFAVSDLKSLTEQVKNNRSNVLYLSPQIDGFLEQLCKFAAAQKILVLSGESSHARKCAAITVVMRDKKPKVLVNLKAAKDQGASFEESLLRISEIIK